jgi:hypothetical protein
MRAYEEEWRDGGEKGKRERERVKKGWRDGKMGERGERERGEGERGEGEGVKREWGGVESWEVSVLPYNVVVDVVLQSVTNWEGVCEIHPWHLHGMLWRKRVRKRVRERK